MSLGLTRYGSEFVSRVLSGDLDRAETIEVGLYHDGYDRLTWYDDLDSVETEPESGEYDRQTFDFGSDEIVAEQIDNGHWQLEFAERILETTDTDAVVDSIFMVIEYESADDDAPTDHLFGAVRLTDGEGNRREEHLEDSNALIIRPSIPIT